MDNNLNFDWNLNATDSQSNNNANLFMAAPASVATTKVDISEKLFIKGYIAGRKNTLTKSFDQEKATEMYKETFDAQAGENKYIIVDGKEIKRTFSQKNFKLLIGEGELNKLKEGNFYKLNVKEGNPEFLICETTLFEEGGEATDILRKKYAVSDSRNTTIVIRPRSLSEVLYNTASKGIIYIKVNGKELGVFSPQKLKTVNKKTGERKVALRYFPINENGAFGSHVSQLGVIKGIPYAVNKSFEGDVIQGEVLLSNEKQIEERYPELLNKLNTIGETLPREVTKGTDQTIPYEDYAAVYEQLGVTPQMLSKLRSKKSSASDKSFTLADITAGFLGN